MKKITLSAIAALTMILFSCSDEGVLENQPLQNANFRVFENSNPNVVLTTESRTAEEYCHVTNLIAGQNQIAGEVIVQRDGDDLIIKYITNDDWTIDATHLSIGNCEEQTIPTTGSGNPKVGHFEHSSEHSTGINEVTYILDASVLDDNYCFAAHAEVSGPSGGETAWAEGEEFDGNNWAMYVAALLSDCPDNEGGGTVIF